MKPWNTAIRDGLVSGSIASLASTAALTACSEKENGEPYAPTNATSHWIWGEHAVHRNDPSARYTLPGYAIHHASSTLWAVIFEHWVGPQCDEGRARAATAGGLTVASLACLVDYKFTPKRLRPGFERRLSVPSLFLVYGIFGLALGVRGLLQARRPPTGKTKNCAN
jgi:hypothetical protein